MKILDSNFNYLKVDFYTATIRNILNCCAVGMYMPALILSLCCIDYIGIPLSENKTNTNKTFKRFLNEFMALSNPIYKNPEIQEIIYAIRCSLIHSFGEADALKKLNIQPEFEVGNNCSKKHLIVFNNSDKKCNCIKLSIFDFISETICGVEQFFRIYTDPNLLSEWYKNLYIMSDAAGIFDKLIIVQNNKIIYSKIHPLIVSNLVRNLVFEKSHLPSCC